VTGARSAKGIGGETSQTLDRGLNLLQLLGSRENAGGMTITQIATALGVGRPVVYRLVATLEGRGFVTRREDGRVRLGLAITELSASVLPLLRERAMPTLRALADTVGATAHLTVVDGGEALAIAVVEPSWTDFHVAYRVGSRHRLEHGAAGRAILGARAGDTAYVVSDGELQAGAHGIAAPLAGIAGLEASIGVVAMVPLDDGAVGPQVVAAARTLAAELG
jgi:DNA-binding IclR family transcriptional regulator